MLRSYDEIVGGDSVRRELDLYLVKRGEFTVAYEEYDVLWG